MDTTDTDRLIRGLVVGDPDRALLLARDHLADDPDHLLAAAMAAALTARRDR